MEARENFISNIYFTGESTGKVIMHKISFCDI